MMKNRSLTTTLIISIFIFGFIINAIPSIILSSHLSTYGRISDHLLFKQSSSSTIFNESLNLDAELGNIKINYVSPPNDYNVKIEVNVEMRGSSLAKKSLFDYFRTIWEDNESFINFSFKLKSDVNHLEVLSLIENVSIIVTLRKDIKFDINITSLSGNIDLIIPFGTSIKNLRVNNTGGDILCDFSYCIIEGNINIASDNGSLVLNSYNVKYNFNCTWVLLMHRGNLAMDIYQHIAIGSNVSGIAVIDNGDIALNYNDNSVDIGALLAFPLSVYGIGSVSERSLGFSVILLNEIGFEYKSYNYPSINNYNLCFNLTGLISIDIESM